ncbi:MAG: membrane protein insertion efficiency factor YidD [Desulfohalobiaceae bacterium]
MRTFLLGIILLYQRLISPWLPTCCRFYPSCSEYAAQAVQMYGPVQGGSLALWRILRCHPLARGGLDPVPQPQVEQPGPRAREPRSDPGILLGSDSEPSMHKSR